MSQSRVKATLRLQFNRGFTPFDAIPLIPYFARLGVSHIYASPLLAARPGSAHGYDVVDASRINSELGGELALEQLVLELRRHDMGLIVDLVSNHMAVVGSHNPWWTDVLMWGERSAYARFFDIDWETSDPVTCGRVLAPYLRQDYGNALQNGEIVLHYSPSSGEFFIAHYEHRFPVSPATYGFVLAECQREGLDEVAREFGKSSADRPVQHYQALRSKLRALGAVHHHHQEIERCLRGFHSGTAQGQDRLHALLEKQHYRLASWRTAADDINWRRFFNVNELGAIRVEDPVVFEAVHEQIFDLLERGWIDGLRVDHIDGLANPRAYCRKLRRRAESARASHNVAADPLTPEIAPKNADRHIALYVEKILAPGERLPACWGVCGTTGYEFMNQVSLLLHDADGEEPLRQLWTEVGGRTADFGIESYQARRFMLLSSFTAELESLVDDLRRLACEERSTRDLSRSSLRRALIELIAHFPVYRSYANACGRSGDDELFFREAFEKATRSLSPLDWPALEQLDSWLGGEPFRSLPPGALRQRRQRALTRFQQLTSPTAAKGVEDTAFYRAAVLLSRYDVGFNAEQFSAPTELFHAECEYRAAQQPATLLTTATHDNKRGEDVRARLAVLSQCGTWYAEQARHWLLLAEPLCHTLPTGSAPAAGDQLILFQTLLGTWPFADATAASVIRTGSAPGTDGTDGAARRSPLLTPDELPENYLRRLRDWQYKALREAKLHTHWTVRNEPYEQACNEFLTRLLRDPQADVLRQLIFDAADKIAIAGALNSLSQCVLRMTTPGVPDLYQGAELWDLALVDPDNRRPVDFAVRHELQAQSFDSDQLLVSWPSAAIKQTVIQRALQARQQQPALWLEGDYIALPVHGAHAGRVLAFARSYGSSRAVVIVPIRSGNLLGVPHEPVPQPMVPPGRWKNTRVLLPDGLCDRPLRSIYCRTQLTSAETSLPVGNLLGRFPVNIYITDSYTEGQL